MDPEKSYDIVDCHALWEVLRISGVGEKLLDARKSLYENSKVCVKVNGRLSEFWERHGREARL